MKENQFNGCGERCFCEHNPDNLKCGTIWNNEKHYCLRCIGKIEGIKLGEKKARDEILEQVLKIIKDEGDKLWEEESVISKIENPIINKIKELQSSNNPEPIMLKDKHGSNSLLGRSERNHVLSICKNCKNRDLSGTNLVCLYCGNNKKSKGDKSEC